MVLLFSINRLASIQLCFFLWMKNPDNDAYIEEVGVRLFIPYPAGQTLLLIFFGLF